MAPPADGAVALFSTRFLPYSQTFIYDEIRAHERYAVDVFCKERLNADRFPYEQYHAPPSWAGAIYENLAYWPSFDRVIGRGGYDLIHAHFGTGAVYALPYVLRHKLPFIITFHGNDVSALIGSQRYSPHRWRYVLYSKYLFRHADLMLCVSRELCALVSELSERPEAVRHHALGVDLERFHPCDADNDTPQVVLIGRFTEKKGHRYALQAFECVLREGRKAHLSFIGAGGGASWCRRYVEEHGLREHVTFAGVLPHEETARRLASADVVLVPSVVAHDHDREGSPTAAKEASACGTPVIGTWHAGLPEIIEDGKTGFLVPERNAKRLAERLITLLDDSALRKRMGAMGREKMEREFELSQQVRRLESYYDEVRS